MRAFQLVEAGRGPEIERPAPVPFSRQCSEQARCSTSITRSCSRSALSRFPATRAWARERIAAAVRAQLEFGGLGDDPDYLEAAKRVLEHAPPPL
jgi:hypothetical protein